MTHSPFLARGLQVDGYSRVHGCKLKNLGVPSCSRKLVTMSMKYSGGILVSISSSRVTHWTTWLHSRVFSAEEQKWRKPLPRTTAAFVRLRTFSAVAVLALVSSRYHHYSALLPPPPQTLSATTDHRHPSSSSSFLPTHIDSSLSRELAAFRQAPRACDDSLHSSTRTALPRADFNPFPCILTVCIRYSDYHNTFISIHVLRIEVLLFRTQGK